VYTVGHASARLLSQSPFSLRGVGTPSAEALAEAIIADCRGGHVSSHAEAHVAADPHAETKPWLFLCGDKRLDVIPARLRDAGLRVEERVVYRTTGAQPAAVREQLWRALRAATAAGAATADVDDSATRNCEGVLSAASRSLAAGIALPLSVSSPLAVLVVYSPSGASVLAGDSQLAAWLRGGAAVGGGDGGCDDTDCPDARCQCCNGGPAAAESAACSCSAGSAPRCRVALAAFGSTTREALLSMGLPVAGTAASPDPLGVAQLVAALAQVTQ
jgi:uroporphyrinogen-III synthase